MPLIIIGKLKTLDNPQLFVIIDNTLCKCKIAEKASYDFNNDNYYLPLYFKYN